MAKIGIVSVYDLNNIGNRLQSYALYKTLSDMGHEPKVIANRPIPHPSFVRPFEADPQPRSPRRPPRGPISAVVSKAVRAIERGGFQELQVGVAREFRQRALTEFTQAHTTVEPTFVSNEDDALTLTSTYDYFVAGSDQIWNPDYRYGNPIDFLTFCRPEQRVAYAASFGMDELRPWAMDAFPPMLEGFDKVSVRETSGAALMEKLTGRKVPVVLDPTLLLPPALWDSLAGAASRPARKGFVATYLLPEGTREHRQDVRRLAERHRLAVVDILAPGFPTPGRAGLQFFLRAIRDAEAVITNSFHATVFALMFSTPLTVLQRGSMNGRISTLLSTAGAPESQPVAALEVLPTAPMVDDLWDASRLDRERSAAWLRESLAA